MLTYPVSPLMAQKIREFPRAEVVTQAELDTIIGLDNQIRSLTKTRDAHSRRILDCVLAGGRIEPGTHVADLEESTEGSTRTIRLVFR
jgi:hypothetical protein